MKGTELMADVSQGVERREQAASESTPEACRLDLHTIVMRYHEAVYRYACRLSGNPLDAEDLTQQTFLMAQQRLDQVRDPEKIQAWLFVVLRTVYGKGLRKARPVAAVNLGLDIDSIPDPIRSDDIDREALQLALDELPDDFRMVLLMFYFEDCSYKEIAAQLEVPIGTVMSRLARAKGHLRSRLAHREEPCFSSVGSDQRPSEPGAGGPLPAQPQADRPIRMDR